MVHIYGEKANLGEACGYALGLIKAGHFDMNIAQDLVNYSKNNQHDRIARSMMNALGLMALGHKYKVKLLYE